MFTDLFSSLDCNQISWFSILLWTLPLMLTSFHLTSNSWGQSNNWMFLMMISPNSESKQKTLLGLPLFAFSLLAFILSMNLLGLLPFVYGVTSNAWLALSMALIFWGMVVLSGWLKSPKESIAHLAPTGAPMGLIPVLILVETLSLLIRPVTLTMRLVANISAGHIILGLISNNLASSMKLMTTVNFYLCHVGYTLFELFVAMIQAYVFSVLIKMYADDHPVVIEE